MIDATERAIQAENSLRQRDLTQMKWIAASLLGFAACLYIIGKIFESRHPAWGYLVAFAEASMVGALADWFAVVALFRHPLGLPIPHTAIIPRNKLSIGNSLADFMVGHFLSKEAIEKRLKNYDAAKHLSQWLMQAENRSKVANYLNLAVSYGVKILDDRRIHDFLANEVRKQIQSIDLSGFIANGFELVTVNNNHHNILHGGLNRFADYLDNPENLEKISVFIKSWSDNAFVQSMIDPFIPTIRLAVVNKIREVAEDKTNGLYLEFDGQIQDYIARLKQDPELRNWVDHQKNALLEHPEFSLKIESLWNHFRDWVTVDLSHPDSVIAQMISELVGELEQQLETNEDIRSWLNDQIQTALTHVVNSNKGQIGDLIREEIFKWDDKFMVEQLELYLGKDLQFIRINGTLVGGLFGLLIHALTLLLAS
jgi:uncharacterized membrane-anchored protein YjiN (DUF445 family)